MGRDQIIKDVQAVAAVSAEGTDDTDGVQRVAKEVDKNGWGEESEGPREIIYKPGMREAGTGQ